MNKGVRAIDNLSIMKHCEAAGIVCDSNLMLHFPSSDTAVEIKVRQRKVDYATMQRQTGGRPALMVRDGGRFFIIDQHFPNHPVVKHRLSGTSATIYRYCHVPRRIDQITGLSINHGPEAIQSFLASMVDKRLMVQDENCYLSLASPGGGGWQS